MFILSNKDTSSDKLAAAFWVPQMVTNQTKIEEQTGLHFTDLSLWHCSWNKGKFKTVRQTSKNVQTIGSLLKFNTPTSQTLTF